MTGPVAGSEGNQCGGTDTPTEAISYANTSGGYYGLSIQRYITGCTNNFGHWMELYTNNGFYTSGTGAVSSFWYANECNSLSIPADANGAVATGATFWGEDASSTYAYGLETFSSFGPRNASGGANPGTTVNKPDVVAPDGVSTVAYGASNNQAYRIATSTGFFGTSGASPHVAGMAASVWEGFPEKTLALLRTYIQDNALSTGRTTSACGGGGTEVNNSYGNGRIHLSFSPTAVNMTAFDAGAVAAIWPAAGLALAALGAAVVTRRRRR